MAVPDLHKIKGLVTLYTCNVGVSIQKWTICCFVCWNLLRIEEPVLLYLRLLIMWCLFSTAILLQTSECVLTKLS